MRKRTEHGLSWLTAISDAGSTPAASTNSKLLVFKSLSSKAKTDAQLPKLLQFFHGLWQRIRLVIIQLEKIAELRLPISFGNSAS